MTLRGSKLQWEVTADIVEITRELELELELELTELLQSHDKTWMGEEFLLIGEQRKWFLEAKTTLDADAVKIVKMTTKDLQYYVNLVDKAMAGFDRIDSNFERSSTVGKMLSKSIAYCREIIHERKSQLMPQTSLLSPQPPQTSPTTVLISQQPSTCRQDPSANSKMLVACWRLKWWLALFIYKVFWIKVCTFFKT